MKTRLPKVLLLALGVAAMPYAVAAESGLQLNPTDTMVTPGTIVGKEGNVTLTEIPDSWKAGAPVVGGTYQYCKPYLKDGVDTTLTVNGVVGAVENPLYIREGKAIINDSNIEGSLATLTQPMIQVAGNGAELTLNDTVYTDTIGASYLAVGGPDGEGILNLNGNSRVRVISLVAGFNWRASWNKENAIINSTAATTDGVERYKNGVHTYNEDTERYFGAATININKGAELELGTTAFLVEAVVNVNGGLLEVGADNTVTPMAIGRQNGCTTELNITNGGTVQTNTHVDVKTGDYFSGAAAASTKISVSGSGSKLLVGKNLLVGFNASQNKEGQSIFEVLDGGRVEAKNITLGRADANELKQLIATVGAGSTIAAEELHALGGADVTNKGTIEAEIFIDGGSLTMADGAKAADLTATAGTLAILGDVVFNGDIMLSKTGFLFTDGATIDLQGHDFSFDGGAVTIVVNAATPAVAMYSLEDEEMLASYGITFKNAGTVTGFEDDIEVTIATMDAEGQIIETGATYTLKASDVKVQSIPEPTTATLSLLALAGLCARRRRK